MTQKWSFNVKLGSNWEWWEKSQKLGKFLGRLELIAEVESALVDEAYDHGLDMIRVARQYAAEQPAAALEISSRQVGWLSMLVSRSPEMYPGL